MEKEIERLQEQINHYKTMYHQMEEMFEKQRDTIDKYHKIFMLQEAELKKLRGKS